MDDLTQNQNVTETDVAGICNAEYKLVSNGYFTTEVKKVKDILSCTERLDFTTIFQSTPYKVPSDLQNLPLMKTSHECDQAVENGGVLKSSVCKESHIYRPFSNGENGAKVTVTQRLTYQTYRNGVSTKAGNIKNRSALLFDHSADHPTNQQARAIVEKKVDDICENTRYDVRPETPRLFTELVSAMKGLDKTDLTELYRLLKTKTMCPTNERSYKYFQDALPMVGTSAAVSLMTDLIMSEDATGLEATAWLTSLAFIHNPTSEMIMDVKVLLDNKKVRENAMLPISSMVNNYCKKMESCNEDYAVISLMAALEKNINYNCNASGKKFQTTLLTLKAIGNAGNAIRAVPLLNKCLVSTSNPLEIRIAAADAFRRMPCDVEEKNLWDTLNDKDLDSELRITAYLALMRCPSEATLDKMVAILNIEDDEQVGAFVYSHLTNLKETSDPHKQDIAEAVNKLTLDKEFDISPLKHSRNFEVSALINKLNTGVTAESNLIWSNKAQLPRAVSGNLTIDLFGHSTNLLDFGGRLEGLEYLIKNIFGPYVNSDKKDSASKILDSDNIKGSVYGRLFGNEMLFMHSQGAKSLYDNTSPELLELVMKLAKEQHVSLTQTVQFMDVCMVIPSSAGLPIHITVNGTATVDLGMSGKMDLHKVAASPRSLDIDGEVRPSAAVEVTGTMFVDSFVTKTGFRMRNTMHTSTAVKGRVHLKRGEQLSVELAAPEDKMEIFDARSKFFVLYDNMEQEQEMITKNRKNFKYCSSKQMITITGMELCGEVSFPNASMKVDSPYFPMTGPTSASITLFKRDSHSGYKLFAKKIDNKKASVVQISFNTPGSQVDRAISVHMSCNYKKQDVQLNMATPWKKVALDGKLINVPELKSMSGNFVVDDKDTYAVMAEVKTKLSNSKVQLSPMIEVRRPGADNVQLTGLISLDKPLKSFNMEMSLSGLSKLPYTVKGSMTNKRMEKGVDIRVSLDGKKEYSLKSSNQMSMSKKSVVVKSLTEVESPERKLLTLSSSTDFKQGQSMEYESTVFIHNVLRKPASLKVNLFKTARKKATNYKAVLDLKSSLMSGAIDCRVARKPNGLVSIISRVDYSIPKFAKNTLTFSGELTDKSTKAYNAFLVQSNFAVKENPEYNTDVKVDVHHEEKLSYVSMDLKYGANHKDKTKSIYFLSSLNKKIANYKNAVISYKVQAQAPAHKIDVLLQGKHQHSPKLLDSNVELTYAPNKEIKADILLKDRSDKLSKINGKGFDGSITVKTPFRGFENMQGSATFDSSYKKYEVTSSLNLGQERVFTMSSDLDYSIEPMKVSSMISTPYHNFRNVELILTHEGGLTNFKTTGFLSSPLTDHINAKASLRYDAAMDMSAAASLQTSLEGFDDLRAEIKTSDLAGEMKTNAVFGWTRGQQIVYEGLFTEEKTSEDDLKHIADISLSTPFAFVRNLNVILDRTYETRNFVFQFLGHKIGRKGWKKKKYSADISLSTSFDAFRSVNVRMDHTRHLKNVVDQLKIQLNDVRLVDLKTQFTSNNKRTGKAELIVGHPWPMQFKASISKGYGVTDVQVYADWNRDEPDNYIHAQVILTDKSDPSMMELGMDLSMTYKSRKVGMFHKLFENNKQFQMVSTGYVFLDYDKEMTFDDYKEHHKLLYASFELGLPTRKLALKGSYSKKAVIVSLSNDATYNWDSTMQVYEKVIMKSKDSLNVDIILSLPTLKKKIKVNGEVIVQNGRIILDTKTDISYSRYSSKTLTLTSKLMKISDDSSHFNYSLALGLKHPDTNVDIQLNSHIGHSEQIMTLGLDTHYLTSKSRIKSLTLLSEINMLKKQINVQFVNPVNKIEIIGNVVSDSPHKLQLMNRVDDVETFHSDVTLDSAKKSLLFNTGVGSNTLSFSAKYPNKSAFRVDLTRHTPLYVQEEALLAVRLNTSRLLHTRLSWHPGMIQELVDYVRPIAMKKADSTLLEITEFNEAVAEELSSKYSAISKEINYGIRPFINVLDDKLKHVAVKMDSLSVELKNMYNRNDFYMQKLGILKLQDKLQKLSTQYRTTYSDILVSVKKSLNRMRYYPAGDNYKQFMSQTSTWVVQKFLKSLSSLESYMAELDSILQQFATSIQKSNVQNAVETVLNSFNADYLANKIHQVQNIDMSSYISSFKLPNQYDNIITQLPTNLNTKMNQMLDQSEIKFVKESLNEVYQQSVWVYNYWQLEENLEKLAKNILKTLSEIVGDELKEYSKDLDLYLHSPITVWDPKHGEIQANIPLPIDVKRLDKLPDFTSLIKKVENFADTHLPDEKSWSKLANLWGLRTRRQMTKAKRSTKYSKEGRNYKTKRFRQ